MRFRDRTDAGEQLANLIDVPKTADNTVVLALPRGGIPLAIPIASKLAAPVDIVLAKKIGHPLHSEFAIGAIAEGGEAVLNEDIFVDQEWLENEIKNVRAETQRRRDLYGQVLKKQPLTHKHALIVDDGIATGRTMFAAIAAVKAEKPDKITVAVPIIPQDTNRELLKLVDEVIAVDVPEYFLGAVGAYYERFPQLSDREATKILKDYYD